MSELQDKVHAFCEAVTETYTEDGLAATVLGICRFFPRAVRGHVAMVMAGPRQ